MGENYVKVQHIFNITIMIMMSYIPKARKNIYCNVTIITFLRLIFL